MHEARILYVDDEADLREIVSFALDMDPAFDVKTCENGREALEIVRDWPPDIILLDVMMPEMDGPETLRALRADEGTRSIPVLFLTARSQCIEIERLLALGAAGVLAKPFDPLELGTHVRRHLACAGDPGGLREAGGF